MRLGKIIIPGMYFTGEEVEIIGPFQSKSGQLKGQQVFDAIIKPKSQHKHRLNMEFLEEEIEFV